MRFPTGSSRRSVYFHVDLEGNNCSRLLDAVAGDKILFHFSKQSIVAALEALKIMKGKCLGLKGAHGCRKSIDSFRLVEERTHLSWTPKLWSSKFISFATMRQTYCWNMR